MCAVRADHPRIGSHLGLDEFLSEKHLVVTTNGTGHSVLERTLEAKRLRRNVGLSLPSFLGLGPVLSSLDYIATLPERLALNIAQSAPIKIFQLPVPVPPYLIVQQWHERYTHDPASRWLRSLIAELFTTHMPATAERPVEKVVAQRVPVAQLHQRN